MCRGDTVIFNEVIVVYFIDLILNRVLISRGSIMNIKVVVSR